MSEEKKTHPNTNIPLLSYRKSEQKLIDWFFDHHRLLQKSYVIFDLTIFWHKMFSFELPVWTVEYSKTCWNRFYLNWKIHYDTFYEKTQKEQRDNLLYTGHGTFFGLLFFFRIMFPNTYSSRQTIFFFKIFVSCQLHVGNVIDSKQ